MRGSWLRLPGRWVVLGALLAKLALLAAVYPGHPDVILSPDTQTYVKPALALLARGELTPHPGSAEPELLRTPGYPALIAAVYAVAGPRPLLLSIVNVVLSAATALLVSATATRLFDARAGAWAAAFFALEPGSFHRSFLVLTEASFTAALAAGILLLVRGVLEERRGDLVASGVALSVATLIRPILTYFLLPAAVLLVLFRADRARRWAFGAAAAFLAPCLVLVCGWQARNYVKAGTLALSQVQFNTLYFYRAGDVVARLEHVSLPEAQERMGWNELLFRTGYADERALFGGRTYAEACPETSRLSFVELNRLWYRRAWEIFRAHPGMALAAHARGLLLLLLTPPSILAAFQWGIFRPDALVSVEFMSGHVPAVLARLLEERPGIFALSIACVAHLLALYALAARGVVEAVRSWRDRAPALLAHGLLLALVGYLIAISAGPEAVDDRLRVPLMPIVSLYAGAGAAALLAARRSRPAGAPA